METIKKSYFHSGGTVPLLGLTIPEHFIQVVKRFPDREAVVSITPEKTAHLYCSLRVGGFLSKGPGCLRFR